MTHKQQVTFAWVLLAVGLLLAVIPSLINIYAKLPDFLSGTLSGFGIGLEIVAFIKLKKGRRKQTIVEC